MYKTHNVSELELDLRHWKERVKMLEQWIKGHDYEHPFFLQNIADLRAAEYKIASLEQRIERIRKGYLPKAGETWSTQGIKNPKLHTF